MTVSPYITEALERAARLFVQYYPPLLPPYVKPDAWPEQWTIRKDGVLADFAYDPAEATRAYLDLVSTLETTGSTSPVEPCDGCSVLSSPRGES